MKKISFVLLVMLQLGYVPLPAQKTIMENNAEVRSVGSFNAISVSSAFDVILSQAPEHKVVVSASDNALRDQIKTEVRNGTLYIGLSKSSFDWRGNKKVRAYISAPDLNRIDLSGSCNMQIDKVLKVKDLEVNISGSSDFKGNVDLNNLRMLASGSSDFVVGGRTENLKVVLSGSSDMKAFELSADFADITCSGASDVQITVNKELSVSSSGSSDIYYKGNAIVKKVSTSGSSGLKKKD